MSGYSLAWEGGLLEGNLGTGVRASFFKTYPIHIPSLGKNDQFIYLLEQNVYTFIECSLTFIKAVARDTDPYS